MPSAAPTIEQLLDVGDRRSIAGVGRVVTRVLRNRALLPELVAALRSHRSLAPLRAADALEKISRRHPDCLAPYRRRPINAAIKTADPVVR